MVGSGNMAWALAAGLATAPALSAYARWILRCREDGPAQAFSPAAVFAAAVVNGLGWVLALLVCRTAVEAVELSLMVSWAVLLTLLDVRARLIPNELVAALLATSLAMALLESGISLALLGRLAGLLTALTMFLVAMAIGGRDKIGGGDVKLAAAVGFATGFPGVLVALLAMALAALLTGGAGMALKRMGRSTPMPFAGFLMAGLVIAMVLDRAGLLAQI